MPSPPAQLPRIRRWSPSGPCSVAQVLAPHRRGAGDPTYRVDDQGAHWRGLRTPDGPATLRICERADLAEVMAEAWGPGAGWALESVPGLLGDDDHWGDFDPRLPLLAEARRRNPHLRIGRTGLVMEALVPAVIEQRVTGQEAFAGFRRLVRRFGEPAPGPGAEIRLRVQPDPETLRAVPSWEWLRLPVDPARSRPLVRAARVAGSLERLGRRSSRDLDRGLCSLPGIGVWTSAEVRQRVLGDPDAVSFGDYHVAAELGWVIEGRAWDDDEMAGFLEPWRPHRQRVVLLAQATGIRRPRRGPRISGRVHLPTRSLET